jgi:hypothetical protein
MVQTLACSLPMVTWNKTLKNKGEKEFTSEIPNQNAALAHQLDSEMF